jgi:MFS family permease
MRNRWSILAVLFLVRALIAVQFQSVGAVAPLLGRDLSVSLADIGVLIGLYFAPGVALALPGGAIGQRFGDKATVCVGLVLMLVGSLMMASMASWNGQIAGRVISGIGAVLLNVLMTKMVADWFAGRELATAMAVFVNSWPFGIAVALLLLPPVATAYGLVGTHLAVAALVGLGFWLLVALYAPPAASNQSTGAQLGIGLGPAAAVVIAGAIWGLYNVGFVMVFSFGPAMLVERGWSMAEAGSTTSIVLWLSAISVPVGGFMADRTQRHDLVLVACCIAFASLLLIISRGAPLVPTMVALGLVCGLAAGPIMRLPALVLEPEQRAFGMGVFFTVFYLVMMAGPVLGGRCATWAGTAAGAFDFGAAVVLACPLLLWGFHRLARAIVQPKPVAA